jgi:hypothetical protein
MAGTELESLFSAFARSCGKELLAIAQDKISQYDSVEHYTSAAGAIGILRNREIWMTNVSTMNDASEIIGGCQIVYQAVEQACTLILEQFGDLQRQILTDLQARFSASIQDTYAFCLSGHDVGQPTGRLTMWRGYGADGAGFCLVLKRRPIMDFRELNFPINWVPMLCETPDQLAARTIAFIKLCARSLSESPCLLGEARHQVVYTMAHTLLLLGIAHKHIQFAYEQEIRLIHLKPFQQLITDRMRYDAEIVRGNLLPIVKVGLTDYSDQGLPGVELSNILEKVIVGPSPKADMQTKAIQTLLEGQGLVDVSVQRCEIPYRSVLG